MNTPNTNDNDANKTKLDNEGRDESLSNLQEDLEIEVRELQRPVRPRGVLAE
jgi:hypothetical protein